MPLALAGTTALSAYAESPFLVPRYVAEKPIKDELGRTRVIIDFVDDAHVNYPKDPPPGWDNKSIHRTQVANLIYGHAKRYGYEPKGMTTWVGNSVTTYLSDAQLKQMRNDKTVKQVSDDALGEFSSSPPWSDTIGTYPAYETWSWGRNATNGKVYNGPINSGSNRRVYIIDSGVAIHSDLPSVTYRVNVGCGSGNCDAGWWPAVGCYAHATHIAGIIGASANANFGTAGVYAGVEIRSVTYTQARSETYGVCADFQNLQLAYSNFGYALDYVFFETLTSGNLLVPIVNISQNSMGLGYDSAGQAGPNVWKLQRLVQPDYYYWQYWPITGPYPGAFVVQSAGNSGSNVCTLPSPAYRPYPYANETAVDGITVVGSLSKSGAPTAAFSPPYPAVVSQPALASNHGACVDVWAPGDDIVSSFGDQISAWSNQTTVGGSYWGLVGYGYSGWARMSGTSMAAPHIAAAAAYVADYYGLTTPIAIEQKLRDLMVWTGYVDASNRPAFRVELP
mgnify:CR=1 FL=1